MREGTKDTIQGTIHEVKGAVKAELGKVTDNPKLRVAGETEKVAGTVQKGIGKVESALKI